MPQEKQNLVQNFTIKGKLIATLTQEDSFKTVTDIINHEDSFEWSFITNSGKIVYKSDVLKLPSEEFPVTVIDAECKINQ